jgi:hypothetical protein
LYFKTRNWFKLATLSTIWFTLYSETFCRNFRYERKFEIFPRCFFAHNIENLTKEIHTESSKWFDVFRFRKLFNEHETWFLAIPYTPIPSQWKNSFFYTKAQKINYNFWLFLVENTVFWRLNVVVKPWIYNNIHDNWWESARNLPNYASNCWTFLGILQCICPSNSQWLRNSLVVWRVLMGLK